MANQDKWKENKVGLHTELPVKWQKYVMQYEDAKSKYKPCVNPSLNNPDFSGGTNNKLASSYDSTFTNKKVFCLYEDVIKKDLNTFKEKIRYILHIQCLLNITSVINKSI